MAKTKFASYDEAIAAAATAKDEKKAARQALKEFEAEKGLKHREDHSENEDGKVAKQWKKLNAALQTAITAEEEAEKASKDLIFKELQDPNYVNNPKYDFDRAKYDDAQMAEIVKAFMTDAKVIIMDEPTAALTEHEANKLFVVIKTSIRARMIHKTRIYVTMVEINKKVLWLVYQHKSFAK